VNQHVEKPVKVTKIPIRISRLNIAFQLKSGNISNWRARRHKNPIIST